MVGSVSVLVLAAAVLVVVGVWRGKELLARWLPVWRRVVDRLGFPRSSMVTVSGVSGAIQRAVHKELVKRQLPDGTFLGGVFKVYLDQDAWLLVGGHRDEIVESIITDLADQTGLPANYLHVSLHHDPGADTGAVRVEEDVYRGGTTVISGPNNSDDDPAVESPRTELASPDSRFVLVNQGTGEITRLPAGTTLVIGRGLDRDLRIVGDKFVSERHVELLVNPGQDSVKVTDLGSTNGTFIQGQRKVFGTLALGDHIKVGRTSFTLGLADLSPMSAADKAASARIPTEPARGRR